MTAERGWHREDNPSPLTGRRVFLWPEKPGKYENTGRCNGPENRKKQMDHINTVSDATKARQSADRPVVRELPADLETPVSAYLKLAKNPPSFLLESVERGVQRGRYSFIGTNPYLTFRAQNNRAIIQQDGRTSETALRPSLKAQPEGPARTSPAEHGDPSETDPKTHQTRHSPPGNSHARTADAHLGDGPDPLDIVKSLMGERRDPAPDGLPAFTGGAIGYLAYDAVRFFEKLPPCETDELQLPDAAFVFNDSLVVFDHVQSRMKIVASPRHNSNHGGGDGTSAAGRVDAIMRDLGDDLHPEPRFRFGKSRAPTPPLHSNFTREQYQQAVLQAKEHILAGDSFQIVLSQRLRRRTTADPFSVYRALRMLNPSPYMFFLDFGDFQLIGSSPEMLVKLQNGMAETRPIAGTRPRGQTPEEDEQLIAGLLADPKELAEHTMLVDLGRNDIGRVCDYGSVSVPVYMSVEKYSHVTHLVSSVQGRLRPEHDAFDLLRASFPAGTLTGAPKVRSMEIINNLEKIKRGPYGGAVGYFGFDGSMDTCITIRTIVMAGDMVYLQAGAGIVADSDPASEYQETMSKIQVLDDAVRLAESWKESALQSDSPASRGTQQP